MADFLNLLKVLAFGPVGLFSEKYFSFEAQGLHFHFPLLLDSA
jgi:hypothetical protein